MYKIKNTELDFESRIFHLHKIFYSALISESQFSFTQNSGQCLNAYSLSFCTSFVRFFIPPCLPVMSYIPLTFHALVSDQTEEKKETKYYPGFSCLFGYNRLGSVSSPF